MTMTITDHASMNLENDHASYLMMQHMVAEYGFGSTADALSWITRNLALWMAEELEKELVAKLSTLVTEAMRYQSGNHSIETTTLEWHCQPATLAMLKILLSGGGMAKAWCVPPNMDGHQEARYAQDRRRAFAGFMHDLLMSGWNDVNFSQIAKEYEAEEGES